MRTGTWMRAMALAVTICVAAAAARAQDGPPPVFSAVSFDRAYEQVKGSGGLLVVQFTASWCGPCRGMERGVWRDPSMEQWMRANATAVLIDIDQDKATAKRYQVQAVPQTIVFRGATMIERFSGSMSAESMLTILRRCAGSGAPVTPPPATPATPSIPQAQPTAPVVNGPASLRRARDMVRANQDEAAASEFVRAWRGLATERASIELDLRVLAARSDTAKRAIGRERDAAQAIAAGGARTFDDLDLWLMLCDVMDERASVVRWYAGLASDAGSASTINRLAFRLGTLLIAGGRGPEGSKLIADAGGWTRWRHATLVGSDPAQRKAGLTRFREDAGRLYGSLEGAGRNADAETLAQQAVRLDDTAWMRIVLVRRAVDGGFAASEHEQWLSQAERMGANVKDLRDKMSRVSGVGK